MHSVETSRTRCGCTARLCGWLGVGLAGGAARGPDERVHNSDVSRISDISIQAYLRTASPNAPQTAGNGSHADMGMADLPIGGARFTPDLESQVRRARGTVGERAANRSLLPLQQLMDEWLPLAGGTGSIHVQVAFKPSQVCPAHSVHCPERR